MSTHPRIIALEPAAGRTLHFGPNQLTWKAVGADTDGRYAMMEFVNQPGTGSGYHVHGNEDEAFFILEGTLIFYLGDDVLTATPGSYILIPKGLRHAFVNRSTAPVRSLITLTPAGLEGWFETVAGPNAPQDAESFAALARAYNLEFQGPVPEGD